MNYWRQTHSGGVHVKYPVVGLCCSEPQMNQFLRLLLHSKPADVKHDTCQSPAHYCEFHLIKRRCGGWKAFDQQQSDCDSGLKSGICSVDVIKEPGAPLQQHTFPNVNTYMKWWKLTALQIVAAGKKKQKKKKTKASKWTYMFYTNSIKVSIYEDGLKLFWGVSLDLLCLFYISHFTLTGPCD